MAETGNLRTETEEGRDVRDGRDHQRRTRPPETDATATARDGRDRQSAVENNQQPFSMHANGLHVFSNTKIQA